MLAADQVFAVSTLNDLEAGYTGASPSTRSCRRRLQDEAIEPPPLAASNFSYIDACTAAGIDPATVLAICDAGCGTTKDENCAYDYFAGEKVENRGKQLLSDTRIARPDYSRTYL